MSSSTAANTDGVSGPQAASISAAAAAMRRKRKRPSGPNSPIVALLHARLRRTVDHLKKESVTYRKVSDLEDHLELMLKRKQQEAREALRRNPATIQRALRLYVLSTVVDGEQPESPKLWKIRVVGKLLADESGKQRKELKMSQVFKKIEIWLDRSVYTTGYHMEWTRTSSDSILDGVEFSRPLLTDGEVSLKLVLYPNERNERYVLSDRLARFIGSKYERRSNVYMCFWQYIKRNNLQIDEDRSYVRIDTRLRELVSDVVSRTQPKVIEANRIRISSLFDLVKSHIRPDSVELECTYNMKNSSKPQQLCFDVAVEIEDETVRRSAEAAGLFGSPAELTSQYQALKVKHQEVLEKIAFRRRRKDFYEGFNANPRQFLKHLFLSQTRDLAIVAGTSGRQPEEERRSRFYCKRWVQDAVPMYLVAKAIAEKTVSERKQHQQTKSTPNPAKT